MEIVELFWRRSETALSETANKYSNYCYSIAFGILRNEEDANESVNDTWLGAWNAMPSARPSVLRTFLGKITRNFSLNVLEKLNTEKRGYGQVSLALSELEDCVPASGFDTAKIAEDSTITQTIDSFLGRLETSQRKVFVRRYWYASSLEEIANDYNMTVSNVKSILFRLRKKLKKQLEKEGILL